MTRTILLAIAVCASACAARSNHDTLPAQTRAEVLTRYAHGATLEQLANEYHLGDRDDARDVVHAAMMSLSIRYYREQ